MGCDDVPEWFHKQQPNSSSAADADIDDATDRAGWWHEGPPPEPDGILPIPDPGDVVWIQARVLYVPSSYSEVGYRVQLFSKIDEYQAWVLPKHVVRVVRAPEVPDEPANGTWLCGTGQYELNAFTRNDQAAIDNGNRHWYDIGASSWIDWPEAFMRGADPNQRLTPTHKREVTTTDDPARNRS